MGAHGFVIVPAAGSGTRMGLGTKKQFLELAGQAILVRTLLALSACRAVDGIVLVGASEDLENLRELCRDVPKISAIVPGGATRQESVLCGLRALPEDADLVTVHDGVRPFVTETLINGSFEAALEWGACVVGLPVTNTVKRIDEQGFVAETPARASLFSAQTPQTFRKEVLRSAYEKAASLGDFSLTDDASAVEKYGSVPVKLIAGDIDNIKITTPADLILGENILKKRQSL